jgi:hypothetical protein
LGGRINDNPFDVAPELLADRLKSFRVLFNSSRPLDWDEVSMGLGQPVGPNLQELIEHLLNLVPKIRDLEARGAEGLEGQVLTTITSGLDALARQGHQMEAETGFDRAQAAFLNEGLLHSGCVCALNAIKYFGRLGFGDVASSLRDVDELWVERAEPQDGQLSAHLGQYLDSRLAATLPQAIGICEKEHKPEAGFALLNGALDFVRQQLDGSELDRSVLPAGVRTRLESLLHFSHRQLNQGTDPEVVFPTIRSCLRALEMPSFGIEDEALRRVVASVSGARGQIARDLVTLGAYGLADNLSQDHANFLCWLPEHIQSDFYWAVSPFIQEEPSHSGQWKDGGRWSPHATAAMKAKWYDVDAE